MIVNIMEVLKDLNNILVPSKSSLLFGSYTTKRLQSVTASRKLSSMSLEELRWQYPECFIKNSNLTPTDIINILLQLRLNNQKNKSLLKSFHAEARSVA
jgi:hypothetical protein